MTSALPYMVRVHNLRRGLPASGRFLGCATPYALLPCDTRSREECLADLAAETQAIIRENREARARLAFSAISQME